MGGGQGRVVRQRGEVGQDQPKEGRKGGIALLAGVTCWHTFTRHAHTQPTPPRHAPKPRTCEPKPRDRARLLIRPPEGEAGAGCGKCGVRLGRVWQQAHSAANTRRDKGIDQLVCGTVVSCLRYQQQIFRLPC